MVTNNAVYIPDFCLLNSTQTRIRPACVGIAWICMDLHGIVGIACCGSWSNTSHCYKEFCETFPGFESLISMNIFRFLKLHFVMKSLLGSFGSQFVAQFQLSFCIGFGFQNLSPLLPHRFFYIILWRFVFVYAFHQPMQPQFVDKMPGTQCIL